MPYNPTVPVIVTDEQPVRLFREVCCPIPAAVHHPRLVDFE